ncbi:MAG: HAMP domain-containing protein [SAR202 cluster bacterium]|nr:HAMP domain-containing protein [SAR202 cluster bacterium]
MEGLHKAFSRLRWKLALSYTLVTVAVLAALEATVLAIAGVVLIVIVGRMPEVVAEEMKTEVAPQLRQFLDGETPDMAGVYEWLDRVRRDGLETRDGDRSFDLAGEDVRKPEVRILVFDAQGRLLGTDDIEAPLPVPEPFNPAEVPGLQEGLGAALAGERDPAVLSARPRSGARMVAVPIAGESGQVIGALALATPDISYLGALGPFGALLIGSVVVFTIAAGLIGTLFGLIAARGLTRRLAAVSAAANEWGRGNFSPRISDGSGDELGQLGRQLDRMSAELEELIAARQKLSTMDERNRLARDLHDSVKQQVFAISMNLGAAQALWETDREAARRRLVESFELARQSQMELAAIIQTLRPIGLDGKPLAEAVSGLLERIRAQGAIAASLELDGDIVIDREAEDALYRLAQEALAKVVRHSRATHVRLTLTARPSGIHTEIADNGKGFDTGASFDGVGLKSMAERMETIGGNLSVTSGAQGTSVVAVAPARKGPGNG